MTDKMTAEQAAFILDCHNKWRRGDDDYAETDPVLLGVAIDVAIKALTAPRVPEEAIRKNAPCELDISEQLAWAEGWNACRESMLTAAPAPADEIATLRERVKVLEEKWAVVFDSYAVMLHMQSAGQNANRVLISQTLDAVAAIGRERAARLRGGSDE